MLKKIIITILIALGYLYGACGLSKTEAAEVIRVALVHDQTTAEISSDSDFVVQESGAKTVLDIPPVLISPKTRQRIIKELL